MDSFLDILMQNLNRKTSFNTSKFGCHEWAGVWNMAPMAKSLLHGQMDKNIGRRLTE